MDLTVNYIRLAWKLVCILRTYRTCNSTVGFSKYEFNNKLLGGVTLLRVTPGVPWTQPTHTHTHTHTHIYIYYGSRQFSPRAPKTLSRQIGRK